MNSYLSLILKSAKENKKKNRLTVIAIAISVMLVVAVFGMADLSLKAQINENIRQKGNYHATISNPTNDIIEQVKQRDDVKVSGVLGVTEAGSYNNKTLEIQGGEQAIAEQMNLLLKEGEFPSSESETLIDNQALQQFDLSIGDTITFNLNNGQTVKLKISGTFEDFSSLKSTDSHGIFLSMEGLRALPIKIYESYYIQFNKNTDINHSISEIKENLALSDEQIGTNMILLGLMGQGDNSSMKGLYLTGIVLFLLITLAGTFMISSSFNMNVLERTQFLGLLRCLGATKKQVKKYIWLEGLWYSVKGIPIGIIAGCILMWLATICLNVLNSQYIPDIPVFQFSWISIVSGTILGFVVVILASFGPAKKAAKVSPQAAVTGNISLNDQEKVYGASNTKWFRVQTAMGLQHALSNKKNLVLISGSFALSIILFLGFSVLYNFMGYALNPLKPFAPDLSITKEEKSPLISHAFLEEVKALPHIKNISGRMVYPAVSIHHNDLSVDATLISYDEQQFKWAKEMLIEGNLSNVQNDNSVLVNYSEQLNLHVDDSINVVIDGQTKTLRITGIVSDTPYKGQNNGLVIVASENTFANLTDISDYAVIDLQVTEDISQDVRNLLTPDMRLLDKIESNRDTKSTYLAMAVFVYGFLFVIALVALINIINTINASVSSRMNNYGVMRAVGMTGEQLKSMIRVEASVYAFSGSIIGSLLGLILHRFIFNLIINSNWGVTWKPPITILVITILAAIVTTYITVYSQSKKVEEMDIVNVIKPH